MCTSKPLNSDSNLTTQTIERKLGTALESIRGNEALDQGKILTEAETGIHNLQGDGDIIDSSVKEPMENTMSTCPDAYTEGHSTLMEMTNNDAEFFHTNHIALP